MLDFSRGIVAKIVWFPYLQYSLVVHSLRYLAHQYFKDVDHDEWWLVLLRKFRQPVAAIETVVSGPRSSLPQSRLFRTSCVSKYHRNAKSELVVPEIDIFASSTGEFNIIALDHITFGLCLPWRLVKVQTSKTDLGVSWRRLATFSRT